MSAALERYDPAASPNHLNVRIGRVLGWDG